MQSQPCQAHRLHTLPNPPASCSLPRTTLPPTADAPPAICLRLAAGYSAARIPEDNEDLTFDGPLHDIAVLKLAQAVPGTPATVPLAAADTPLAERQKLQVAGWGTTEAGTASNILK